MVTVTWTCETCRFWNLGQRGRGGMAECRYNPPVAPAAGARATHPITEAADWCGKHEPRSLVDEP